MKIWTLGAIILAEGSLCACGTTVVDRDNYNHGCTIISTSGSWNRAIDLYHNDPTSCPAGGNQFDLRTAGGTLKDVNAFTQQQASLSSVELKIYSTADSQCSALGSVMGSQEQDFRWSDFNGSGHESWNAPIFTAFLQGSLNQNYDCPVFYAHYFGGDQGSAITRIKYYVNDF